MIFFLLIFFFLAGRARVEYSVSTCSYMVLGLLQCYSGPIWRDTEFDKNRVYLSYHKCLQMEY